MFTLVFQVLPFKILRDQKPKILLLYRTNMHKKQLNHLATLTLKCEWDLYRVAQRDTGDKSVHRGHWGRRSTQE